MSYPYPTQPPQDIRAGRPGTVIAGAVIAIVMCSLFALAMLIMSVAAGSIASELDLDDMAAGVVIIGLIFAGLSVVGIIAGARTIAGSNAWRITLAVLASLTALLCLFGSISSLAEGDDDAGSPIVGIVWGILAVIVVVLLFAGGANAWFAAVSAQRFAQPGYLPPAGYAPSGYPPRTAYGHDPYGGQPTYAQPQAPYRGAAEQAPVHPTAQQPPDVGQVPPPDDDPFRQ